MVFPWRDSENILSYWEGEAVDSVLVGIYYSATPLGERGTIHASETAIFPVLP